MPDFTWFRLPCKVGWLAALPDTIVQDAPHLSLVYAWALIHANQLEAVEQYLQNAEIAIETGKVRGEVPSMRGEIAAIRARVVAFQGDSSRTIELSQQALALLPEKVVHIRGEVALNLGIAYISNGNTTAASQAFVQAKDISEAAGNLRAAMLAARYLAQVQVDQGLLHRPLRCNSILEKVEHLTRQANFTRAHLWLKTDQALIEIARGNVAAAANWEQTCGLDIDAEPTLALEYEYFILARMLLAQGKSEKAIHIASQLVRMAEEKERTGVMISNLSLLAAAYEAANNSRQATYVLGRALSLAEPQSYIRTFINMGTPMECLLKKLRKVYLVHQRNGDSRGRTFSLNYIDTLLAAFGNNQNVLNNETEIVYSNQPLLESLSEREQEVLQLLVAGQSNREIAQHLIVGLNTVKTHVKSIYVKLDVHSRTQALVRAQALHLL